MEVLAYAKLNLTLRIVGRRPDGYHELQSLVTAVDLADRIAVAPAEEGITLVGPTELGPPEGNLAHRAARALLPKGRPGVRIELEKRIPVGAGLGGGSSDAGAVLAGLNELFSLGKSPAELAAVAADLGADVPFFLGPSPAWVEGIGDRITPLEVALPQAFLILIPPFRCPTAEVYRAFRDLGLPFSRPTPAPEETPPLQNDLWPAAAHVRPELREVRKRLEGALGRPVGMTGSGSALFAAFPSREEAERAGKDLDPWMNGDLVLAVPVPRGYKIER